MGVVLKYGLSFLLIASIAVSVALLLLSFSNYNEGGVAINYCIGSGSYEERSYSGSFRGYCVFSNVKCGFSECPVMDYYLGACKPCDYPVMNCSFYENVRVCEQDYSPVCARIRSGTDAFIIREKTFGNACSACVNSKDTELVTTYVNRSCDY